jgi:hypothetical protein
MYASFRYVNLLTCGIHLFTKHYGCERSVLSRPGTPLVLVIHVEKIAESRCFSAMQKRRDWPICDNAPPAPMSGVDKRCTRPVKAAL